MPRMFTRIIDLLCLPGKLVSWLMLVLIAAVLTSVVAAKIGSNVLFAWDGNIPVLGRALTVNSLVDLQWYIFALIVLFGGIWALRDDGHVSVDFLALAMTPTQRLWVRMLGDLVLLVPFCLIIVWYSWNFAAVAWQTAEGSTQGGLNARWIIKAVLPLSFGLLALVGLLRGLGTAIELARGATSPRSGA